MVQTLRATKMERTRQAIVAAGMELFAERGFDAVTVADIAGRADIGPRTFHRYYPDKAELLFVGDDELHQALHSALRQQPPGDSIPVYLLAVLEAAVQPLTGRHAELVVREGLLHQAPALRARDLAKRFSLEQTVAEHIADRLGVSLDHDVRPRWWAGVAFATFTAAYQTWLIDGGALSTHLQAAGRLLSEEGADTPAQREHPPAQAPTSAPA